MRRLMLTIILVACMCSTASALNWHRFYQTGPYDTLRYRNIGWGCSGSYGRFYGRSNSAISGGYLALNALRTVAEIQQQNRVLDIVEGQFAPQPQRIVVYQQSVAGPVLNRSNEEIRARFKQQELEQRIKILELEIEKLKLELEQAKKTK